MSLRSFFEKKKESMLQIGYSNVAIRSEMVEPGEMRRFLSKMRETKKNYNIS
jgi:hypothetical protein